MDEASQGVVLSPSRNAESPSRASVWDTLFRDPRDGRLWEKIYPMSEMHGGGPPTLRLLPESDVVQKYGPVAPKLETG